MVMGKINLENFKVKKYIYKKIGLPTKMEA